MKKAGTNSRKISLKRDLKEESRSHAHEQAQMHPLLNPAVLANLFNVVKFDVGQFSTFRLVCKEWNKLSLPVWRKNAELVLHEEHFDDDNFLTSVGYMTLLESPNDSYQLKRLPFRTYKIHNSNLDFVNEDVFSFWKKIGTLMWHLCLDMCTFKTSEDFRKIVFELTPNLESLELYANRFTEDRPSDKAIRLDPTRKEHLKPINIQENLKKFHADLETAYDDDDDDNSTDFDSDYILPTTWMELFVHFPKIDGISLQSITNEDGESIEELVEFLKSMEIIRDNVGSEYFAKLKLLDVFEAVDTGAPFPSEILTTLKHLKLPLKELSFYVGLNTTEDSFKGLLSTHAITLEALHVMKESGGISYPNFPFGINLPCLENLHLGSGIVTNLHFLRQTPSLKTISMGGCIGVLQPPPQGSRRDQVCCSVIANTNFDELNDLVLPTMKTFCIGNQFCTGELIVKLGKLMPNLTYLHVGLGNDGFQIICEVWNKLEVLEIHPFQVDESGLLGMRTRRGYYHYPNITDLRDLKAFRMGYLVGDKTFKMGLSNAAILHGILPLHQLKQIVACLSPEVDDEVCNQLVLKFPRCKRTLYKKRKRTAN